MYNFATSAPPETLEVNGGVYSINTDYRVWIEVFDTFLFRGDDPEALLDCVKMVFDDPEKVLQEQSAENIISAMCKFLQGYPEEDFGEDGYAALDRVDDGNVNQERYFDFKYDLNLIIIAIRNQSGIDLSYKCKHFHWWLFLLEFNSLESHHKFCEIRSAREYDGKDKEMLKQKKKLALPRRYTTEQRQQLEEFNKIFYDS